jgi:hypothetical protein
MNQIIVGQYSVVPGEKAILKARVTGNAFVQVSAPMAEVSPNRFECIVDGANIPINILVTFPDSTPGSRVDLTIEGEINGNPSGGPFPIDSITPASPVKSPQILLVVTN